MKTPKPLLLLFITSVLISCSTQQIQIPQPTTIIPTTILTIPTTSFLDFEHPRLHEIAGNKPLVIDEITRSRPDSNQDITYAAVIVETGDPIFKKKMLLFQINKSKSVLIYESEAYYFMTFNMIADDPIWLIDNSNFNYYRSVMGGISQFASSYLEVPFVVSNGGNCYDCTEMKVIGIAKNGTAEDITPAHNFTPKAYIDISNNFKFEIIATRYYEWDYGAASHVGSPYAFRLYAWDGNAYVDVSKEEKDFFDKKTNELVDHIKNSYEKPFVADPIMPFLSEVFFNYESSRRVDFGWEQIKSLGDLSHWDVKNTPPEEIKIYHEVFDELEQRKNEDKVTPTP